MKDKTNQAGFGIISAYIGRSLTAVVALFVIGVAVSALMSGGGSQRNIVDVCVYGAGGTESVSRLEPFRALLSDATRRPVVLHPGDRGVCDVYLMDIQDYLRSAETLGVEAVYEVRRTAKRRDSAVLVAAASAETIDYATLSPREVAFSAGSSMNGYLSQISMLASRGFLFSGSPCGLQFVGGDLDHSRVVLGVANGVYRLGACRMSTLTRLISSGVIGHGEVTVVGRSDALPENVVAVPAEYATYYRDKLDGIAKRLDEFVSPSRQNETAALLKARGIMGLEPVDVDRIKAARQLFEQYGCPD